MTDYDRLKYRGTFNKLLCDKKRIINFLLKFRRITIDYFDIKDKKKKEKRRSMLRFREHIEAS